VVNQAQKMQGVRVLRFDRQHLLVQDLCLIELIGLVKSQCFIQDLPQVPQVNSLYPGRIIANPLPFNYTV